MRISDANAATSIGRWAYDHRELITDTVRRDIAHLAEQARRKLLVGLTDRELAELRGHA